MRKRQNYIQGRAFENRYRRSLEAAGWIVMRSAGSRGPFDLVYWWKDQSRSYSNPVHGVQLKRRMTCAAAMRLRAGLPRIGLCDGHVVHETKDGAFCEH